MYELDDLVERSDADAHIPRVSNPRTLFPGWYDPNAPVDVRLITAPSPESRV